MESHAESAPQIVNFAPSAVYEALCRLSQDLNVAGRQYLWRVLLRAQVFAAMIPNDNSGLTCWAAASTPGPWGPTCALFTSKSALLRMFPDYRPTLVRFSGIANMVVGSAICRGIILDPGMPNAFVVSPADLGLLTRGQLPPEPDDSDVYPHIGSNPEPPSPALVRLVRPALSMVLPLIPTIHQVWMYTSSAVGPPDETCIAIHVPQAQTTDQINQTIKQLSDMLAQTEELRCQILLLHANDRLRQQLLAGAGLLLYQRPN